MDNSLVQDTNGLYQFTSILGFGGYGTVYEAMTTTGHPTGVQSQIVAIKKCRNIFVSPLIAKRTLREIIVLSYLNHPNIVNLYKVHVPSDFDSFDCVYLCMDCMPTDLNQMLKSDQILSVDHRRYIMYQLLLCIQYLHSCQIIHRDLKPSNVLLNEECEIKLCDFGLARVSCLFEQPEDLTEYVTTRWYRPPEILLSYESYGPEIDMWSAGCILAEMILKTALFPGSSQLEQISKIYELLGKPTEHDIRDLVNPRAREYISNMPNRERRDLAEVFKGADPDELDLLGNLLTWDPSKRFKEQEALNHPYFQDIRSVEDDAFGDPIQRLPFDNPDCSVEKMKTYLYDFAQRE